ncbi:uncharacterized protein LOC131874168 [Cryptomeria japonica]|uniref:uncharacterized protein LOC131874168 n=1 Tax=Cryptomeria japonica TaxID=3369 RepID=UPI0027D9F6BA|nr:uncharacterized protein LOC131874168 [Cryptomeria japonica]
MLVVQRCLENKNGLLFETGASSQYKTESKEGPPLAEEAKPDNSAKNDKDTCMMEAVEPRTTWVMPMGYEAGTSSTPTGTSTGMQTRAGKQKAAKKEEPVVVEKGKPAEKSSKIQFQKRGKVVDPLTTSVKTSKRKKQQAHKPTSADANDEDTESKKEKKVLRTNRKKCKVVGTSTIKSVEKPVNKPTSLDKLLRSIKEYGVLKGLKKLYDNLGENEQRLIEDAVAMKQDREFVEYTLKNLQPEATKEELDDILLKEKSSFRSKKRLTRMLIDETQSVQQETEILLRKSLGLIPTEEEYDEDDEPEKINGENFPEGVKPIDFDPDDIVLDDQPNQEQEGKKDEEEKKDEEPPVDNQTVDTQTPPVKDINEDKQENKTEETEKEKEEEKTEKKEGTKENKTEKIEPIVTPL